MVAQHEDWKKAPPYSCGPEPFLAQYRAQCYCGAVAFEVSAEPVDSKVCHCRRCQSLHGAPFQWAVIFEKPHVRFVRGVEKIFFYNADTGEAGHVLPCKLSCSQCHSPIADEGRRMFLAFGPLFDFGSPPQLPLSFEPTCHIFYGQRVIEVNDGRPKYLGHKGRSPLEKDG